VAQQLSVQQLYSNRQDMWLSDGLTLLENFSGLSCFPNECFAHLFPQNGRTVEVQWRLAFITVVQFIEGLPDRQAADAVWGRIESRVSLRMRTDRSRL
jgi:hypothetical protein